jgi:hypothetical protein
LWLWYQRFEPETRNQELSTPTFSMDKEKLYLAVANDEPYMPLRLHFSIKKKKVYDVFQALGSVDYDKEQKAFDWYYEKELTLSMPFDLSGVPSGHDLVLSQMKFSGMDKLMVICNSFKKAMAFLEYFSQKLGAKYLKLVEVDLCNWVYEVEEESKQKLADFGFDFFDKQTIEILDSGRFMKLVKAAEKEGASYEEALEKASQILEEEDKLPYPEFQKRKIGSTKQDRESFPLVLMMVQRVALQRFADGNTSYGLSDAAQDLDSELYPEG